MYNRQQAAGIRRQAAGSIRQAASSRHQAAGIMWQDESLVEELHGCSGEEVFRRIRRSGLVHPRNDQVIGTMVGTWAYFQYWGKNTMGGRRAYDKEAEDEEYSKLREIVEKTLLDRDKVFENNLMRSAQPASSSYKGFSWCKDVFGPRRYHYGDACKWSHDQAEYDRYQAGN